MGDDLLNELVHNLSSLDHQLNAAGLLQIGDHFFDGVAADDGFAFGAALQKLVHLGIQVSNRDSMRKKKGKSGSITLEVVRL